MLNYGWVYPQALLIFTVTLAFSVVMPLILIFGALYFGVACESGLQGGFTILMTPRPGLQIQAALQ